MHKYIACSKVRFKAAWLLISSLLSRIFSHCVEGAKALVAFAPLITHQAGTGGYVNSGVAVHFIVDMGG